MASRRWPSVVSVTARPVVLPCSRFVSRTLSLLPVLDSLAARAPDLGLLVTTGTVTSAALLAQRLPAALSARVQHRFAPLDVPSDASEELPGMSAFYRDEDGQVFHTYSSYTRGLEELIGTLMILDRAPKGRNESSTMSFVRRHDEYEDTAGAKSCCAS